MMNHRNSNRPLKILHVVYSFGIGGSESVAREVALILQERGHKNMVVALDHDGPLSAEFRRHGIAIYSVNKVNKTILGAMGEITDVCREFQPDVIHTHHMYTLFYTVFGAFRAGAPIVHTEHEFWSLDTLKGKLLMPFMGCFCGKITAVNDDTKQFMADVLRLQKRKLETVLNGIDLRRFNGNSALSREDLGLKPEHKVAGIVARLEPVKNHAMLLRAWKRIAERLSEAMLLIVGEGSLEHELKAQVETLGIKGHVRFLGPRRDVHDLLPLMDVAVLTSINEGLPMFLLEAMAVGLPVAAAAVGGVPKLIRDGEHGRLVGNDDDAALAEAVVAMFANPDLLKEMGRTNMALVKGRYDLEASVDRYFEMYCDLTGFETAKRINC